MSHRQRSLSLGTIQIAIHIQQLLLHSGCCYMVFHCGCNTGACNIATVNTADRDAVPMQLADNVMQLSPLRFSNNAACRITAAIVQLAVLVLQYLWLAGLACSLCLYSCTYTATLQFALLQLLYCSLQSCCNNYVACKYCNIVACSTGVQL